MKSKCRKLIALLLMVTLIVTYTFGANMTAFAEEGQGDANAKASTSESADPTPQDEPTEPTAPAPTDPTTPEPTDPATPGDDVSGDSNVTDQGDADVAEEEVVTEKKETRGDKDLKPTKGTPFSLEYGKSREVPSPTSIYAVTWSYEVAEADAGYVSFDNHSHVIENKNDSDHDVTVTVRARYRNYLGRFTTDITTVTLKHALRVKFMAKDIGMSTYSEYITVILGGGDDVPTDQIPQFDSPVTVDGTTYKFYSWYTDERCTEEASLNNVRQDMIVYGMYKSTNKIIFKKNTSDAANIPDPIVEAPGTSVNLGYADGRDGYMFAGWNTAADGSGTPYDKNADIDMPDRNLTLFAQWEEDDDTITINYYRGYYGNGSQYLDSQTVKRNAQVELLDMIPSRPGGWVFSGWEQRSTGTIYYPQQSITPADHMAPFSQNLNLYATWDTLTEYIPSPVHANGKTVQYNGEEQSISGIQEGDSTITFLGTTLKHIKGDGWLDVYVDITAIEASGTNVGHYTTPVSAEVWVKYAIEPLPHPLLFSESVEVADGVLNITPCELTISTESAEKEYDGEPLTAGGTVTFQTFDEEGTPTKHEVTFTHDGDLITLVNGETLNVKATGERARVGSSENNYEVDWGTPDDGWGGAATAKKSNYTIIPGELGTLTVKPIEVIINVTLSDKEVPYNGELQAYYAQFTFDTDNERLKAEENYGPGYTGPMQSNYASGIEVGEYQTNVKDDASNFQLTNDPDARWVKNYNPTYVVTQGTLTITAVPATVTYKLSGGTYNGSTDDVVVEANAGDTITILDAPTREGYEFQYWKGSKYYPGDEYKVPLDGHEFTAVWAKTDNGGGDDSDKDKKGKDGDGSSTGDTVGLLGIFGLLAASILGLCALTLYRRREE